MRATTLLPRLDELSRLSGDDLSLCEYCGVNKIHVQTASQKPLNESSRIKKVKLDPSIEYTNVSVL